MCQAVTGLSGSLPHRQLRKNQNQLATRSIGSFTAAQAAEKSRSGPEFTATLSLVIVHCRTGS